MQETLTIQSWLAARIPEEQLLPASLAANENRSDGALVGGEPAELDAQHETVLRELLTRPAWSLSELRALTSRFDLMPWACVSRLNEWATEEFGDLLLEGDETINVNQNLKERIQV